MAADANLVVNVNLALETPSLTRAGFGVPAILGVFDYGAGTLTDRIRSYANSKAVAVDFPTTSEEYIASLKVFGQTISPTKFYIARRATTVAQNNVVTVGVAVEAAIYSVTIKREVFSHTASGVDTSTTIATALTVLITASTTLNVDATDNGAGTFDLDPSAGFENFSFLIQTTSNVTVADNTGTLESVADAMNAIALVDDTFYGITLTKRSTEVDMIQDITDLALDISARTKLMGFSTAQASAKTSASTDIFSVLQALSYDHVFGVFSSDFQNYPELGWMGLQLPKDPGSTTWKFQTVAGFLPETLTSSERGFLVTKNANFFETLQNETTSTSEAKVAVGEYIDVMRGADSTVAGLQEDVISYLKTKDRVAFTDPGITGIASVSRAVMRRKENEGFLVPESSIVTQPLAASIPAAEKGNRQLKGMEITGELQGAVHFVNIDVTLSV